MRMIRVSYDPDEDPAELVQAEYALLKPAPYGWDGWMLHYEVAPGEIAEHFLSGGDPTNVDADDTFRRALAWLAEVDAEPTG